MGIGHGKESAARVGKGKWIWGALKALRLLGLIGFTLINLFSYRYKNQPIKGMRKLRKVMAEVADPPES